MNSSTAKPPVNRWATGIRMATVVVVLGTLAAAWHPRATAPAAVADEGAAANAPVVAGTVDSAYFPSRFPAPENIEPQAPTF